MSEKPGATGLRRAFFVLYGMMTWYANCKKAERFWGKEGSGVLITCQQDGTGLLLLRSAHVEQPGTWGIPGGAVQQEGGSNEDFFDSDEKEGGDDHVSEPACFESAIKETTEEMGTFPAKYRQLGKTEFTSGAFKYTSFIIGVDLAEKKRISSRIVLNWENTSWKWFQLNSLPSSLHFGVSFIRQEKPELFGNQE